MLLKHSSETLQTTKKLCSIFLAQIHKGSARPWERSTARRDRNEPCPWIDDTGTMICYSRTFAIASICLSIHAEASKFTLPDFPNQFDATKEHNAWVTMHHWIGHVWSWNTSTTFCILPKFILILIYIIICPVVYCNLKKKLFTMNSIHLNSSMRK